MECVTRIYFRTYHVFQCNHVKLIFKSGYYSFCIFMIISCLEVYSYFCCFAVSFSRLHSEIIKKSLIETKSLIERMNDIRALACGFFMLLLRLYDPSELYLALIYDGKYAPIVVQHLRLEVSNAFREYKSSECLYPKCLYPVSTNPAFTSENAQFDLMILMILMREFTCFYRSTYTYL